MMLFDLKKGQTAVIKDLPSDMKKLKPFGWTKGERITVLVFSPFRSAMLVQVKGRRISLSRSVALEIGVSGVCGK